MIIAEFFRNSGRVFEVEAERSIVSMGSIPNIHLVLSGEVLLHSSSVLGRELVMDVLKPGHLFGLSSLFGARAHFDVVAWTKCRLAAVEPSVLERAILGQPALAMEFLKHCMAALQRRGKQVEDFALLSFPSRLAKWFLRLAEEQGVDLQKGAAFQCDFSQTLIARMVGVSRETVSRQMQRWEDAGIVAQAGKTIALADPALLQKIAEGFPSADQISKA
jgi:CRP/FNR family cyclic AMP-dependent transcriptional regulator